jgi:hypothetical protein
MKNDTIKTGNVTEWTIIDNTGTFVESTPNRKLARAVKNLYNLLHKNSENAPYRIAKTVVTK